MNAAQVFYLRVVRLAAEGLLFPALTLVYAALILSGNPATLDYLILAASLQDTNYMYDYVDTLLGEHDA